MRHDRTSNDEELRDILEAKLTALFREMEDADWSADEVALAMDSLLKEKWLAQAQALRAARESLPKDFVSDGNEG